MAGQHRARTTKPAVAAWLGAGAITLGVGAALTTGAAVAGASTDDSGAESSSAGTTHKENDQAGATASTETSAGPKRTAAVVTQPHSDDVSPIPKKKPRHRAEDKDEDEAAPSTAADSTAKTATTRKRIAVSRPSQPTTHDDDAVRPTPPAPTAAVERSAVTTTTANPKVAAPATAKATATPARATPVATATSTSPPAAGAVTNPLNSFVHGIQAWIKKTFNNTAPTVTLSTPTKNTDGTYTGLLIASDVDGDPLTIQYTPSSIDGTIALTDQGDGTYTYAYLPSASALTTPNYTHHLFFTAVETNAASHFHGPEQIRELIVDATWGNLLRALINDPFNELPRYSPFDRARGSASVPVAVGPVVPLTP